MPTAADFVNDASSFIGTPYEWGGASPAGFDCSGLVQYSLERLGLRNVPRTSQKQYAWADPVAAESVEAGDLVFLNFPGEQGAGHVAIYAGSKSVIQAPKAGEDVQRVPFTPLPAGSHEWGGTILGYGRVPGLTYKNATLEALWLHAGGPPKVAKIMAAIALAESGGQVGAVGGPNSDGTYDYGLWQINSSHHYVKARLLNDPGYNARAAVAVYRSQGLQAWSTYTSGAYRRFMSTAAGAVPLSRPPRPGAASTSSSSSSGSGSAGAAEQDAASGVWASYEDEINAVPQPAAGVQPASLKIGGFTIPGTGFIPNLNVGGGLGVPGLGSWNPLGDLQAAGSAVSDIGSFLHWIAWIFSPRNILRIVEFLAGAGALLVGVRFALEPGARGGSSRSNRPTGKVTRTITRTVRATPAGRELALARAAAGGRRKARATRQAATAASHREEEKRAAKQAQRRAEARRKPGETRRQAAARRKKEKGDIPF